MLKINSERLLFIGFPDNFKIYEKKIVLLLLKHKANVNAKNRHGNTPLHHAYRYEKTKFVLLLLDHKANSLAKNNNGTIPYHFR